MRQQEKTILDLIDSMPGMVIFKDYEGHWLKANKLTIDILQLNGINYFGKHDSELADLSNNPHAMLRCITTDERAWHKGSMLTLEESLGDTIWEVKKQPIYTPANSKHGIIIMSKEITREKILQESILQSFNQQFLKKT